MTKIGFFQFLFLLLVTTAYGQKVKYKDIFALLETQQYEQAEPFLKQYLEQNSDNPNAYLYMGNILREKALKIDILRQTEAALTTMDSAVYHYDRAHKTLDDREVRRNRRFYQAYNRRDLRTGEFGVKLSDIQFDIEKKIEGLQERIEQVKTVAQHWSHSRNSYQKAQNIYTDLQKSHASLNQLFLRADDEVMKSLETLSLYFDSCVTSFDQYKNALTALGRTGYNPEESLVAIKDFTRDGESSTDFLADAVALWDYKTFADDARKIIESEIIPMRKNLITFDAEMNKLRDKFFRDSVSVRNDLMSLVDRMLDEQLRKYDETPLPMWVFALKSSQLEYLSSQIEHTPLRDSVDVHFQLGLVQNEMGILHRMDSLLAAMSETAVREEAIDYASFVTESFGSASGVVQFGHDMLGFVERERARKAPELEHRIRALDYIVDASDSIPLVDEIVTGHKPLLVSVEEYTVGLSLKDSTALQGYFYTVTPSRQPDVKALFPLDKSAFRIDNLLGTHALGQSDPDGQIYYVLVYSEEAVNDKFPAVLAKIYRFDGLAWHMAHPLPFLPSDLMLSLSTGEVIVSNGEEEIVFDKNGEMVER